MISFIKRNILFVIIGLIFVVLLNLYAIKASKVFKDGAAIICEQKREGVQNKSFILDSSKPTVLFMGNSLILSGIVPSVFDSVLSENVFSLNLSLPALPVGPHYFLLKDYMNNYPKPDKIVLLFTANVDKHSSLFDYYAIQGMESRKELTSYFWHRDSKSFLLNYFLPMQLYDDDILRYAYYSIKDKDVITSKKQENVNIVNKMFEDRGYYFIKEESRFPGYIVPEDYTADLTPNEERPYVKDPFEDDYTKLFFDYCKNNQIEVLLISAVVRNNKYKQYKEIPESWDAILTKYSNVKMAINGWKLKYYDNKFFSDERHLNYSGARMYTIDIANEFNSVFSLTSLN